MSIALVDRFGTTLDALAGEIDDRIPHLGPGRVKDLLSGTWQGHPLHPVLTDVTVGAWTSAGVLDLVGDSRGARAARTLIGVGVLSAAPAAITGWSEWVDVNTKEQRRVGLAHAIGNVAATAIYAGSWLARRRGNRTLGIVLGTAGAAVASVTASLGGHLVFREGVGVDVTAFDRVPARFTPIIDADELEEGTPKLASLGGVPVFLLRRGDEVIALHDACTHRGGPLHKGQLVADGIECPWHGSRFCLDDGTIQRGPASAPQPRFRARIKDGKVEIHR